MERARRILAKLIATAGGVGYAPIAPGTAGTAAAVPLAWLCAGWPWWAVVSASALLFVAGTWAASRADAAWGTHDDGRIVIDEVVGYLLTVAWVDRSSFVVLGVGFVVFRLLDIVKPPPMRWIDRRMPGGLGVMLDDVAAGLLGAIVMVALTSLLA